MLNFGYGSGSTSAGASSSEVVDLDTNKVNNNGLNGNGVATDITVAPETDDVDKNATSTTAAAPKTTTPVAPAATPSTVNGDETNANAANSNNDQLEEGTTIVVGDDSYTVNANGQLVDKDGKVFKEAKDVQEFIKGFDLTEETDDTISFDSIREKLGIDVVDENGKPIQFDNTPEGVSAYIESVIETRKSEFATAGINQLIETYPIVQDVINYYVANGNSLEGFNSVKDRSNITIDEKNVAQQEAIIRESFKEFNKKGADDYIQYLKDKGTLFNVAKDELQALVDRDNAVKEETAKQAREKALADQEESDRYWKEVQETIKSRKIGEYKIPDTIIINKDGKKIAASPNDFYNYLYQVDENGVSRYGEDLDKMTPKERLDDSLLRAYLRFTGASYNDLVNLAIKEKEVVTLRLKAKQNNRTAKVVPPTTKKPTGGQNMFGY